MHQYAQAQAGPSSCRACTSLTKQTLLTRMNCNTPVISHIATVHRNITIAQHCCDVRRALRVRSGIDTRRRQPDRTHSRSASV